MDDYEALGIFPDTWTCIATGTKQDTMKYLFWLAASGVECHVTKDPDGKRWHLAVKGGLKHNPIAWIVNIRGEAYEPVTCVDKPGQHPQVERVKEEAVATAVG
jgi:hypothetical protein